MLREHRQMVQQEELHLRDLQVELGVLLGDYGEDADRVRKLEALLAERVTAEKQLTETRKRSRPSAPTCSRVTRCVWPRDRAVRGGSAGSEDEAGGGPQHPAQ